MSKCLLCQSDLSSSLTLEELLSFKSYQQKRVCTSCLNEFTRIKKEQNCPGCSRPQNTQEYCLDCVRWRQSFPNEMVQHIALFEYDSFLKNWLHTYKFQGDIRFASVFASEIQRFYRRNSQAIFVPLPISGNSMYERGFNQCEELLRVAHVPYQNLLENIYFGEKQSEKNRKERLQMEQPFQIHEISIPIEQKIILFDDVYTTGRTLLHAKKLLYSYGYQKVTSLTIAR